MAFLDVLGAIATPVTSLVGGVFNMIEGSNNRDFNEDMQYQSQDFQREMFAKQNAEYDRRFQKQIDYNNPKNIMSLNAQAGINPIFGTGGNSGQTFGAPDPSVQSPPSSVTPPYVNMSASGDLSTTLEKIGSFVGNLAKARKDVAEGTSISKLMDGQVENLRLSNAIKNQELIGQEIDNVIKGNTGLKKALMDIRLAQSQVNLNTFLGYESESKKELIDWQSFAEQAKIKLSQAEYLKIMQLLPLEIKNQEEYTNVLREEGKKYRAEGTQAYAAAELSSAQARTENDLRKWKVENLRLENEGKSVSNVFASASQEDKLKIIKANLSEAQFEARMAEIRKMDMEGYSALHRLLFSETHQGGDFKKAANLMQKQVFRDALGL